MKCPFLRDASVKYCEASAFRKMLPKDAIESRSERCSSNAYTQCPAAAPRLTEDPSLALRARCPFLHEAQAEFCAATSLTRFIPATTDLLSRCNSDGHLYCEAYLSHADPLGERRPRGPHHKTDAVCAPEVDGILVPRHLHYAPNHMWMDVAPDGCRHVGIDAFAARLLGKVDRISFVVPRTLARPVAVLEVRGVDVQFVFPKPLHVVATNVYLRTSPEKLIDDPYGAGWLFEAVESSEPGSGKAVDGLLTGGDAAAWMHDQVAQVDQFVHPRSSSPAADGLQFMADGGTFQDGLAEHLDREDLIQLITEVFSPHTEWRRSM